MLHGRVARCTARALRIVIAGCTNCGTLRKTAASRDSRCMLHVASFSCCALNVFVRYVRVAAAAPTDGVALAHARQLFQISGNLPIAAAYWRVPLLRRVSFCTRRGRGYSRGPPGQLHCRMPISALGCLFETLRERVALTCCMLLVAGCSLHVSCCILFHIVPVACRTLHATCFSAAAYSRDLWTMVPASVVVGWGYSVHVQAGASRTSP
jgi:hypothetical protein